MKNKILGVIATVAAIAILAACASMTIVSVDWDSLKGPAKVRQYFSVSTTDVSVYANYKDDSRKEVTFLSTSHDRDRIGMQTVTVTVLGQGTGTFQTEVMELLSIRVDRPPTKTTYTVGERADLAGIKVMGSWRDFPEAEVPAYQVEVASFDSGSAGNNRLVTVNFKGKRATFPVTVVVPAQQPAPAASQPSQPSQQQPSTQPPAQQGQMDQRLVGTWRMVKIDGANTGTSTCIYNANGTGSLRVVVVSTATDFRIDTTMTFTWSVNGNRLTENRVYETGFTESFSYTYSVSGNTLTTQGDDIGNLKGATNVYTRQ